MTNLLRNIEKSSFLIWVVGLMSVAVSILVMFQYRWVEGVMEVNDHKFQRDVIEALHTVSNRIERKELSILAAARQQAIKNSFRSGTSFSAGKKLKLGHDTLDMVMNNFDIQIGSDLLNGTSVQISLGNHMGMGLGGTNSQLQLSMEERFEQLIRRSQMMDEIFESMMNPKREILERLSTKDLDSLLKYELSEKGIDLHYDYGIFSPKQSNYVLQTGNIANASESKKTFKAALFPNDVSGVTHFLMITFPNKTGFLLKKIWLTLASSALLVFVIIFCFAYAVYTIFQQKKLSEMKTDFINNMTHEFKTPIATISLACEALGDKDISTIPKMKEQYIGIIDQENKRLGTQVEKVLQIAMIEKDKLKLNIGSVCLQEIMNKAMSNLRLQVDSRSGDLILEDLSNEPLFIEGDEMHLTNVINNLLDNANKYSPKEPKITMYVHNNDSGVYLSVSDNGCGMTQEQQNKVFDKFYRVSTGDVHDVKGFGLGLSYVKYVIDAHHGDIKVSSTLGQGSTFEVFLPYKHA